jgi:hypothetical protein
MISRHTKDITSGKKKKTKIFLKNDTTSNVSFQKSDQLCLIGLVDIKICGNINITMKKLLQQE